MKIIKHGLEAQDTIHRLTCRQCGSIFEFYRSEGRLRGGERQSYVVINCPVCLIVNSIEITKH